MIWKKIVLALTIVIAVVLGVMSVRPASVPVSEFNEVANVHLAESSNIPFSRPFSISGLAVSGSWEGPGFAELWFVGENDERYLVLDTRKLLSSLEFSSFGTRFESVCFETCNFAPVKPKNLFAIVSGPGFLSVDSYHFAVPFNPSGLAVCPNCKTARQLQLPDHSSLVLILMLVLAVIGSHALSHICKDSKTKRVLSILFISGFVALGGVFGVSVAAPTSAFAVVTKQAASIFSALGVIVLFVIAGIEMLVSHQDKPETVKPTVWKELEEAEESWTTKK